MALYRWVLNIQTEKTFLAATLGTAGHTVIEHLHKQKKFNYSYIDLLELFELSFNDALKNESTPPPISVNSDSLQEDFEKKSPEYVEMLEGYQASRQNRDFFVALHEQSFVLPVRLKTRNEDTGILTIDESVPPLLFTGTMDQGGVYMDGVTALRDIKFRDNAFKPSKAKFDLDIQMTIYATAMAYGHPVCKNCKPRFEEEEFIGDKKLVYDGPCSDCMSLEESPSWPSAFPQRCELVWMRDYERYKRNYKGKKKGDFKGSGFLLTYRRPRTVKVLMSDIIRICELVRNGQFYRNPGSHCDFWCGYKEHCKNGFELEVEEASIGAVVSHEDPF